LLSQKEELRVRVRQTEAMIRAVDAALAILDERTKGGSMDMKEIFDGFDPSKYEDEARERWGNTDAYKMFNCHL
jgi:MerR family transcriptional regulator, thiopeptide resistance regulator